MLKDAVDIVKEKNQTIKKAEELSDIKGVIKTINYEETMNFNNFLCADEVKHFNEQTRKVTNFIGCLDKHVKKEIWKPTQLDS